MMNRAIYAVVLVLLIGIALYPAAANQPNVKTRQTRDPNTDSVHREMTAKIALVNQDVRITEELCRQSCMIDAGRVLAALNTADRKSLERKLSEWRTMHPHVEYVTAGTIGAGATISEKSESGQLVPELKSAVAPYLTGARHAVAQGENYLSPRVHAAGKAHFVFGRVAEDGGRYMIGVVNQRLLNQVADHQLKNMRIESFPAEKRPDIKTVDSESLQPKGVIHPEQGEGTSHYKTNEIVVKFRQPPSEVEITKIHSDIGGKMNRQVGNIYIFISERMEAKQLMSYFRDKNIVYAEPHFFYMTNEQTSDGLYGPPYPPVAPPNAHHGIAPAPAVNGNQPQTHTGMGTNNFEPNDTLFMKYQWNLRKINTESGWQTEPGNEVIVGVIDTGADLSHPDLQGHLAEGLNIINPGTSPEDDVGHGTHVAGVIAALTNNQMGVAGMTWGGRVMPVKALDSSGAGSTYSVAQGIIWATDHGAKVINMSLGNYADSNFLKDAIKYAYDRDVVLVAASGNDNTDRPSYPAFYPEVFAVAATDANDNRAPFSNYGDYVDGAAPGVSIASTYPDHQYAALSGTSMASPHAAALAALIRSINPSLRNTEVMDIMRKSAHDLGAPGPDYLFGSGLIDVNKAVEMAQQK